MVSVGRTGQIAAVTIAIFLNKQQSGPATLASRAIRSSGSVLWGPVGNEKRDTKTTLGGRPGLVRNSFPRAQRHFEAIG